MALSKRTRAGRKIYKTSNATISMHIHIALEMEMENMINARWMEILIIMAEKKDILS